MGRFARQFHPFFEAISADIFKFCAALNFEPTWQQAQLLEAVQQGHKQIAVKSGQGPGKTTAAAVVIMWRTIRFHMARTVATAPTMRQLKDALLTEIGGLISKAHPLLRKFIRVTKTRVEIANQSKWEVLFVTATRVENAQGYHNEHLTVIADEASGVSREIITQFKGTLKNEDRLFLLIGNPNTRDCAFFDCFNSQAHAWKRFTWNAEDTARDYPHIVSPSANKAIEEEFSRDSDVYRIRVLGEFPHSDPNCVISSEDLAKCCDRSMLLRASQMPREAKYGGGLAKQFGQDFARFGGDESTTFRRSGNAIVDWARYAHTDPSVAVDDAFRLQSQVGWRNQDCVYVADASGMGQGIMHKYHNAEKQIVEFHNGGKSNHQDYDNKITEAWFHLARLIKAGRCYIPNDNLLAAQLCNRQYHTTKKGKLVLESKDEYMKRGYDSPDRADGCVLAFYDNIVALSQMSTGQQGTPTGVKVRGAA